MHVDDVLPLPPPIDSDDQRCLQMIVVIINNRMGLVNPDGEVFTGLSRATNIAHGGLFRHDCYFYVLFVYYI